MKTKEEVLLQCMREKFPSAIINIQDNSDEAEAEQCILNAMDCWLKENEPILLLKFLKWMNMVTEQSPMLLETDNDDIIKLFISSNCY